MTPKKAIVGLTFMVMAISPSCRAMAEPFGINVTIPCGDPIEVVKHLDESGLSVSKRLPVLNMDGHYAIWEGPGNTYSIVAERPDNIWCILAQKLTPT